ncbi:unnamed protein product [Penicillium roqueforti FM164]|uniref:Genomic scaffold, ProqFM164S01 n=1 Tax=Penicillium roqueforti (strain FM164) TaxID=1365484 RepID=W6Q0A4_PENRF|nr:unnamed protein product [Penicillium roqueforti FM164]
MSYNATEFFFRGARSLPGFIPSVPATGDELVTLNGFATLHSELPPKASKWQSCCHFELSFWIPG